MLTDTPEAQAPHDERLKDAVAELREGPRELVDLYNDYACPWAQWGLALEMIEIANYADAAYVRQLWDVYLRQVPAPSSSFLLLSLMTTQQVYCKELARESLCL